MRYRKAVEKDMKPVAELFNSYRVFYGKKSAFEAAEEFIYERLNNSDSEIFVAENGDGNLVGFVQLYPLFSSTRMEKLWLLNDLFVNPDFRGKGVSISLIEKAKNLVRETNACGMFLETSKSNLIGNKLYPKTGFELNNDSNYYEWNKS
ncbi:GNAT family N-acetyltransferase [Formosa sp. PL04]|uniref:GNAT family N-acetyltransferase n=1 Tax=Formosa sp. PL04 TaxID=3081755 RepID=UPI0029825B7E|nr:GNAT family N-acetyltransferase [Formosa sp. PL04]MDW5289942.1 GNAT family N-acetyltransferase [Formosa sp. PL04]